MKEGEGSEKANRKQMQPKCLKLVNLSEGTLQFIVLFLQFFERKLELSQTKQLQN